LVSLGLGSSRVSLGLLLFLLGIWLLIQWNGLCAEIVAPHIFVVIRTRALLRSANSLRLLQPDNPKQPALEVLHVPVLLYFVSLLFSVVREADTLP
jgi:hypothetical protein